jgi:type IV pilus assembly protein PilB
VLVEEGAIDRARVEEAAVMSATRRMRMGEVLIDLFGVEERTVWRALAAGRGLPFAVADELVGSLDILVAAKVPRRYVDHELVLPIARVGTATQVATANLQVATGTLKKALGTDDLALVVVCPTDFKRLRTIVDVKSRAQAGGTVVADGPPLLSPTELAPEYITLFNSILLDAIGERASDVHLEIYGATVRVRMRVDGDLHDARHLDIRPDQLAGVINVIKVNADLDIAERRLPQGGRFRTQLNARVFDVRVQTQPSLHGEHVVMRLLPHDQKLLTIEDLGFDAALGRRYRRLLESPSGLVLVVGPTGSGKSTTLYAGLQVLASDTTRKVITVEDPIEYSIDGIQQVEARPDLGFSFAQAMRSFVREDPDVILVGEIRDQETALEAVRASQTGHIVLSTLHCNDAPDAVQRLADLGMHANSLAAELLAVFAQRLVRRVCQHCRVEGTADPELLAEVFPHGAPADFACFKGLGCPQCRGRGTHGRIAVIEFMPANANLRRAIAKNVPLDDLRDVARAAGLVPMRDQALELVKQGAIEFDAMRELLSAEHLAG